MKTHTLFYICLIAFAAASACTLEEIKDKGKAAAEKSAELAKEGAVLAKEGYEAAKPALEKGAELAVEGAQKGAELAKEGYEAAKPTLEKGAELAVEGAQKAAELAKEGYDASKPTLNQGYEAARDGLTTAAKEGAEIGGNLSAATFSWISDKAKQNDSISALIHKGSQVTDAASEIYKILDAAIDTNTDIEVIYQPVNGDPSDTDKAIQAMPRVEVINGLQVGFQDMTGYQNAERVSDSSYMVVWRQGDRLIGFIYRSRSGVKLDVIIKEAPKLIELVTATTKTVIPGLKSSKRPGQADPTTDPTNPTPPPAPPLTPPPTSPPTSPLTPP